MILVASSHLKSLHFFAHFISPDGSHTHHTHQGLTSIIHQTNRRGAMWGTWSQFFPAGCCCSVLPGSPQAKACVSLATTQWADPDTGLICKTDYSQLLLLFSCWVKVEMMGQVFCQGSIMNDEDTIWVQSLWERHRLLCPLQCWISKHLAQRKAKPIPDYSRSKSWRPEKVLGWQAQRRELSPAGGRASGAETVAREEGGRCENTPQSIFSELWWAPRWPEVRPCGWLHKKDRISWTALWVLESAIRLEAWLVSKMVGHTTQCKPGGTPATQKQRALRRFDWWLRDSGRTGQQSREA